MLTRHGRMFGAAMAAALVVVSASCAETSKFNPGVLPPSSQLILRFEDAFDGPRDAVPNPEFWAYDTGANGWGNHERQAYTSNTENVRLDGDGRLLIQAVRDAGDYTSARIVTRGNIEFTSGLIEVRAKLPAGRGIHPAVWLLGSNIDSVGYPAAGEIDIVELTGSGAYHYSGLHGPWREASDTLGPKWKVSVEGSAGLDLSEDFHTYAVYRTADSVTFGIDQRVVGSFSRSELPAASRWVFDSPFYLLMNIAVGGDWPGAPDGSTRFPATMEVDSVRYFVAE